MLEGVDVVSRDTTDVVLGKSNLQSPCALGAQVSPGDREVMKVGHCPEALSIYPYFQSSWPNRTVYQVGFDREVSFSEPIIPMPCVRKSSHLLSSSEQQISAK